MLYYAGNGLRNASHRPPGNAQPEARFQPRLHVTGAAASSINIRKIGRAKLEILVNRIRYRESRSAHPAG